MVDSVYSYPASLGGAIWSGIDDIFHLSKDKICGYGPWGPIDGWRREKPEYIGMKKSYAPVIITNLQSVKVVNGKMRLELENRYNFTNLNELKIKISFGSTVISLKPDIAPLSKGSVDIDVAGIKPADILRITFTDPRGFICQDEIIPMRQKATSVGSKVKVNVTLGEDKENWIIRSGKSIFKINKVNGLLGCTTAGGSGIITNGGEMMLVPFNKDDGGAPGIAANNYTQGIQPLDYLPVDDFTMDSVIPVKNADGTIKVTLVGGIENKLDGTRNFVFQR